MGETLDDWGTALSDLPPMHDHQYLPDFDIDLFCADSNVDDLGLPMSATTPNSSFDVNDGTTNMDPWNPFVPEQPQESAQKSKTRKRMSTTGKRTTRDRSSNITSNVVGATPTRAKRPKSVIIERPPQPFNYPSYVTDNNPFDDDNLHMQVAVHDGSPVNTQSNPDNAAFDALSHPNAFDNHQQLDPNLLTAINNESTESDSTSLPNHLTEDLHLRILRASDPSLSTGSFVSGSLVCQPPKNKRSLPAVAGALVAVRRAAALYVSELRGERPPFNTVNRSHPVVVKAAKFRQGNVKGRTRKPGANRRVRRKEHLTSFTARLPPLALERMPPIAPGALTPLQCYMQYSFA